jgi:DNA-binding SARP family transcriptional activator
MSRSSSSSGKLSSPKTRLLLQDLFNHHSQPGISESLGFLLVSQKGVRVKQPIFSSNESSLLDYAISTLCPEVFSHPAWTRFGESQACSHPRLVEELWAAATELQSDDPGTACQILLLCAVCQNKSGQYHNALQSIDQVLTLAEATNLRRETVWAMWGACAVSLRHGDYQTATKYLEELQVILNRSNEWILANLLDVLRQSLFQPVSVPVTKDWQSPTTQPFGDALAIILNGLQHWGFSQPDFNAEPEEAPGSQNQKVKTLSARLQSFFSMQHWQGRWRTLMLAFRGELRVQWVEHEKAPAKPWLASRNSVLNSLDLQAPERRELPQSIDAPEASRISFLPSAKEVVAPPDPAREIQQVALLSDRDSQPQPEPASSVATLSVHMLGTFNMTVADAAVKLPASRAVSLLKYLLLHHKQTLSRDMLMDIFWPDAEPEMARNNLNVSLHSLRKALRAATDLPIILFEDGMYSLSTNLQVWLDVEEFERCIKAGQRLEAREQLTAAILEYETAISLYQGDFLEQNPYEEWTILDRERLRIAYLDTLDRLSQIYFEEERYSACRTACQLILQRDPCREDAHCLLMRCYSRQRQHHLALRQYQVCAEMLRSELQVEPAPETTQLYNRIRRREQV